MSFELTSTSLQPVCINPGQNGLRIIRFDGSKNPLTNTATFTFRHLFVVGKYSAATFASAAGLVTDTNGWGGLIGVNGGTVFKSLPTQLGTVNWKAKVNGAFVDAAAIPAPMNAFKLIEIRADAAVTMAGIVVGRDRANAATKWNGDFCELLVSAAPMLESDVWETEEYLMAKWDIH